ncbi:MAG: hypothetical protein HY921_03460 [Elusimicrobia bacterium]|nr:hypothetical protein [Elusimicrobiota bacterium]
MNALPRLILAAAGLALAGRAQGAADRLLPLPILERLKWKLVMPLPEPWVYAMAKNASQFYLAGESGLHVIKEGRHDLIPWPGDLPCYEIGFIDGVLHAANSGHIWVLNGGWELATDLPRPRNARAPRLAKWSGRHYAATGRGVFIRGNDKSWAPLHPYPEPRGLVQVLEANFIGDLDGGLAVATNAGVFSLELYDWLASRWPAWRETLEDSLL